MKKFFRKCKQIILYGGLEREQYKTIASDIDESNRKSIVILSLACLVFYAFRLCLKYSAVPRSNKIVFIGGILLFAILAVVNQHVKNRRWLVHTSAYLFMAFYLGIGILSAIGPGSIQERTTLYLVFIVVAPMLYALNAVELAAVIVPAEICYLILIARFQATYPVYVTNKGNSVFFALSGLLLGVYMANRRISGIYDTYRTARMEEIEALNRELALNREQLKNALELAEQANRAKTTFLNSMSHDIRTPMNAIVGFTELAARHMDQREQVEDYLGKIQTSSQHLLALINDVLDMSRIESGTIKIEEKPLDLFELVQDLHTIIQSGLREKQLQFSLDTDTAMTPVVLGDHLRIQQVLLNILGNAVKFTPVGGKILFQIVQEAEAPEGYARFQFQIRDTGIGMSKEYQKRIFEAFSREETETVHGIQGTGLGMAITKNLVDLMQGTISVESEEGKGTEFTITLCLKIADELDVVDTEVDRVACSGTDQALFEYSADMDNSGKSAGYVSRKLLGQETTSEKANHADPELSQKDAFAGKKILLVEDNELNQEIAKAILIELGLIVDIAENGAVAVEKMRKHSKGDYDLILMDIQMPKLNGYEAARQIRALENSVCREIPIVAMTANAFEEDKQEALAAGMNGHLAKPVEISKLREMLQLYIGK